MKIRKMRNSIDNLVSVIMPSYNCGDRIHKSIDSVINQNHRNWELIIVDDKSTDNTFEVISNYTSQYDNIIILELEKNSGAAVARTKGIEIAKGRYIAFLDSDDFWVEDKLEKQISFMELNNYDFTSTAYELFDEYGESLKTIKLPPKKVDYNKMIDLSCPIGNLTVMYNQDNLGKFVVPDIRKRNDLALWLQILKKTEACYGMDDVLAGYTIGRSGSLSKNKLELAKYHWDLYYNIEKLGIVKSILGVLKWAFIKGTKIGLRIKKID